MPSHLNKYRRLAIVSTGLDTHAHRLIGHLSGLCDWLHPIDWLTVCHKLALCHLEPLDHQLNGLQFWLIQNSDMAPSIVAVISLEKSRHTFNLDLLVVWWCQLVLQMQIERKKNAPRHRKKSCQFVECNRIKCASMLGAIDGVRYLGNASRKFVLQEKTRRRHWVAPELNFIVWYVCRKVASRGWLGLDYTLLLLCDCILALIRQQHHHRSSRPPFDEFARLS